MVDPISKTVFYTRCSIIQESAVELDPGWRPHLSTHELNQLLENQTPFTYIISPLTHGTYLLSFLSESDQGVVHIQFDRLQDSNWHYVNGGDNILPSLKGIIRKMMHLTDTMPDPTPCAR